MMYGLSMVEPETGLTPYTKITLNLIPAAARALTLESQLSGHNRTDVVNRAIQVYSMLMDQQRQGKQIHVLDPDGTTLSRLIMI